MAAENLSVEMSDFYDSKTGQKYPTKFVVKIPDFGAELNVASVSQRLVNLRF